MKEPYDELGVSVRYQGDNDDTAMLRNFALVARAMGHQLGMMIMKTTYAPVKLLKIACMPCMSWPEV